MPATPKNLIHVDREELFTSLPARIQYLHSFLEFGPDDVQALVDGQKYIKAIIPAIVNIVYKKLLKYDITARVFTTHDSRYEGPVDHWVTEESTQIQNRKMFLRWYLTKLNSDPTRMEYWEYLDKVGLMHTGKVRREPLHVDYVLIGACLGYIQDALFEAILSHPHLTLSRKIGLVKALGKVIWIQNDLFAKWHSTDGLEYRREEDDEEELDMANDPEGYLHGKKILGNSSDEDTSSISTTSSGKTSLGRPIEEAKHLSRGCPFSGEQRATITRSPRIDPTRDGGVLSPTTLSPVATLSSPTNGSAPRVRIVDRTKERVDEKSPISDKSSSIAEKV